MKNLNTLVTESINPRSQDLDQIDTIEIVKIINQEDKLVAQAIEKELANIAKAVDSISLALKKGGRLIYLGAGTSGRLGVLDASECPPTYGVSNQLVQGLIAGGEKAIRNSIENAEDSKEEAIKQLKEIYFSSNDILVGIAASGKTPYVVSGLEYANYLQAKTVALSCNPDSKIAKIAKISITPVVGPEVVTGSTRMKAGTAQKMVLNILSTATMIKLGKVYKNYMVDLQVKNQKLAERAKNIITSVSEVGYQTAEEYLKKTDFNVKLAIMMIETGLDLKNAKCQLANYEGHLAKAIKTIKEEKDD